MLNSLLYAIQSVNALWLTVFFPIVFFRFPNIEIVEWMWIIFYFIEWEKLQQTDFNSIQNPFLWEKNGPTNKRRTLEQLSWNSNSITKQTRDYFAYERFVFRIQVRLCFFYVSWFVWIKAKTDFSADELRWLSWLQSQLLFKWTHFIQIQFRRRAFFWYFVNLHKCI